MHISSSQRIHSSLTPSTLNPEPRTLNPVPCILNPIPMQGRARPSLAALYNWRYEKLGDLPNVTRQPEYRIGNAGMAFDYQLIDVPDGEESAPLPYFYQASTSSLANDTWCSEHRAPKNSEPVVHQICSSTVMVLHSCGAVIGPVHGILDWQAGQTGHSSELRVA